MNTQITFRTLTLHLVTTFAIIGLGSSAFAGPHEVSTCEQDGSTLSGTCIDGSSFSLTCTDETDPVECDLDEVTAWDICGDQCGESNTGQILREKVRAPKADGVPGLKPKMTFFAKQSEDHRDRKLDVRNNDENVSGSAERRVRPSARRNTFLLGRNRAGSLSISKRQARDGGDVFAWTYRNRRGVLVLQCNTEHDTCAVFENGRQVTADTVSSRGVQMAQQANQLMQISNWQDDVPTDWFDGLCYAAGIAAGFWPIGTAIAGPTAVGCLVMYTLEE